MSEEKRKVEIGGHKNVIAKVYNASNIKDSQIAVGSFWEPVICWLAERFPKWDFVGESLRGSDDVYVPCRWQVYADNEHLGTLSRDYYGHKPCYAIENNRIRRQRERGFACKTTNVEKAQKLVLKNFRPKDLQELMQEARARVDNNVIHAGHTAQVDWRRPYVEMMEFLSDYMMNKFDELSKEAVNLGMSPAKIPKIKDAWEMLVIKQGVSECHKQKAGAVVLIHGSTYVVGSDKGQTFTCESATLPVSVKRKVGMLKLLEDDNYLLDVGYRQNGNTFYICNYME